MFNILKLSLFIYLIMSSSFVLSQITNGSSISKDSSWSEIRNNCNLEIDNTWIKVGSLNTSVFDVEERNGMLYTKKPTIDGYYERSNFSKNKKDKEFFVKTGESIKSGTLDIQIPNYKYVSLNNDRDKKIITGYSNYKQPLKRNLDVYIVKENANGNKTKRFLFSKEFTVFSQECPVL